MVYNGKATGGLVQHCIYKKDEKQKKKKQL